MIARQSNFHAPLLGVIICGALLSAVPCLGRSNGSAGVEVRVVTDEAEAVLAILAKKKAGQAIDEADWQRLFASEGYVRLKKRELEMRRSFEDTDFKAFVLSDDLAARAQALENALASWRRASVEEAGRRALLYLPKRARIKAKIYPVIKPKENSFVFEVKTDPAIFFYLDPGRSRESFENGMAHELHHVGYGGGCPSASVGGEISRLPVAAQNVLLWLGAFGEGFAMLAAAGSPDVHPHAASRAEDRERWDRDVANFDEDFRKVEKFFMDVLENRQTEKERVAAARSFYGTQGPWYTVGWKMAVIIEKTYGRAKLIECMCDLRKLPPTYNQAAAKHNRSSRKPLPLWPASLVKAVSEAGERERAS